MMLFFQPDNFVMNREVKSFPKSLNISILYDPFNDFYEISRFPQQKFSIHYTSIMKLIATFPFESPILSLFNMSMHSAKLCQKVDIELLPHQFGSK